MKKKKPKLVKFNPVAMHQLINKGGRHGPTGKAIRRQQKVDIQKNIDTI